MKENYRFQNQSGQDVLETNGHKRPLVKGKFFCVGDEKLWIRGVTYGTFKPDENGKEFCSPDMVANDFSRMQASGINLVRVYTPPPIWLLDIARQHGLYVMVGLPWEQHITFLHRNKTVRSIKKRIRMTIRELAGHQAVFCYAIGNEIPACIVRWHGKKKIERFLKSLHAIAKKEDPEGLVTYVNFPTTEYLELPFLDFQCFNVYLEEPEKLEAYLKHLQVISGDIPLVMGEIGLDSRRNGMEKQAEAIDWQIRTAFRLGCAGTIVFAWTDEWHRGGYDIEDWDFGLTDRKRIPKKALQVVEKAFAEVPFPSDVLWPRISVVVCSYNGSSTIRDCFESLLKLDYPDLEVIVVNDGSTDNTAEIAREYDFKLINTCNRGLSNARNTGLEAATGEIVAYIDDDAYPDRDWLKYLAAKFMAEDCAGVGGPNIAPHDDGRIADCIANSPGGPLHVLVSDIEAEHIPGCNMAFRRKHLKSIGGFDPQFRVAGDDVDLCWRLQQRGWWLTFASSAVVWHHRRNSIRTYLRQQIGYGKAEALLERKWPQKYNSIGHIKWTGRIYGNGPTKIISLKKHRIYYGPFGVAPFQSLYSNNPTFFQSLFLMPEWYLVNLTLLFLSVLGFFWKPLLFAWPILVIFSGLPFLNVTKTIINTTYKNRNVKWLENFKLKLLTGFLHTAQPMARLYGRLRHGLSPWRRHNGQYFVFPLTRKYTIWSENWKTHEYWAEFGMKELVKQGGMVKKGGDYDHWDLEISSGMLGTVRFQSTVEEHGGGKQLVRFRSWPVIKPFGYSLIFLFTLLSVLAAADKVWIVAFPMFLAAGGLTIHIINQCGCAMGICRKAFGDNYRSEEYKGRKLLYSLRHLWLMLFSRGHE
jgi:O-antigen biosynthesis protein